MENDNCHVEPLDKPLDEAALATAMAAYLAVGGMGCPRDDFGLRIANCGFSPAGAPSFKVSVTGSSDAGLQIADLGSTVQSEIRNSKFEIFYWADVLAVMPATDALAD